MNFRAQLDHHKAQEDLVKAELQLTSCKRLQLENFAFKNFEKNWFVCNLSQLGQYFASVRDKFSVRSVSVRARMSNEKPYTNLR